MAAFTYKYRVNGIVKAPAEVTGAICQQIIEQDGVVTPEKLVDVSRPEDAPLHEEFEWDDDVAAEKYRQEQARQIIKNVIIVEESSEDTRNTTSIVVSVANDRAFVSNGENKHEYITLKAAISDEDKRNALLENAKRDMISFRMKYYRLQELATIIKDIDDYISA